VYRLEQQIRIQDETNDLILTRLNRLTNIEQVNNQVVESDNSLLLAAPQPQAVLSVATTTDVIESVATTPDVIENVSVSVSEGFNASINSYTPSLFPGLQGLGLASEAEVLLVTLIVTGFFANLFQVITNWNSNVNSATMAPETTSFFSRKGSQMKQVMGIGLTGGGGDGNPFDNLLFSLNERQKVKHLFKLK
jgi:hypothetical protein